MLAVIVLVVLAVALVLTIIWGYLEVKSLKEFQKLPPERQREVLVRDANRQRDRWGAIDDFLERLLRPIPPHLLTPRLLMPSAVLVFGLLVGLIWLIRMIWTDLTVIFK